MPDFTTSEKNLIKKLNTPPKIQDFINSIPFNFEEKGDTLKSPLFTIRKKSAHCFEGALLGAYLLSQCGFKPLILYLQATRDDYDHVIAPFKQNGLWGALSKTNHAVLRYREPVYKTIRELVMSYFHEYFLHDGRKTLRRYSEILNLNEFEDGWEKLEGDLWGIDEALDQMKHYDITNKNVVKNLRKADLIERRVGKVAEWKE